MMAGGYQGTYNTAVNRAAGRTLRRWRDTFSAIGSQGPTQKAMAAIGAQIVSSTIERMDEGVTPSGSAHKPLTPEYEARKRAQGYSADIWQRTGESKRKVQVIRATRKSVIVAINTPYSGWANSDGRVPRPVIGMSSEDTKATERILLRDVKQQLDRMT